MLETRPLQTTDYETLCSFAQTPEELFYIAPSASYPWTAERFAEAIAQRQANTVFTQHNTLVGFANIYNPTYGEKGFIGNVVVNPAFRQQGIGKKILHHMIGLAFSSYDFKAVHLSCFSTNTTGLLLYNKLGFKPYGIEQRTNYKNEPAALIHFKLGAEQDRERRSDLDLN